FFKVARGFYIQFTGASDHCISFSIIITTITIIITIITISIIIITTTTIIIITIIKTVIDFPSYFTYCSVFQQLFKTSTVITLTTIGQQRHSQASTRQLFSKGLSPPEYITLTKESRVGFDVQDVIHNFRGLPKEHSTD
ncbi:hypothetical protein STEG23_005538, partial [Scotinomys teguina]